MLQAVDCGQGWNMSQGKNRTAGIVVRDRKIKCMGQLGNLVQAIGAIVITSINSSSHLLMDSPSLPLSLAKSCPPLWEHFTPPSPTITWDQAINLWDPFCPRTSTANQLNSQPPSPMKHQSKMFSCSTAQQTCLKILLFFTSVSWPTLMPWLWCGRCLHDCHQNNLHPSKWLPWPQICCPTQHHGKHESHHYKILLGWQACPLFTRESSSFYKIKWGKAPKYPSGTTSMITPDMCNLIPHLTLLALPTLSSHQASKSWPNHLAVAPTAAMQAMPSSPSTSALYSLVDPVMPTQKHPWADSADSEHNVNNKVTPLTDGEW